MTANPLAIDHRRLLERSVNRARIVAEAGAEAALIALGFDGYVAPGPRERQDRSLVGQLHVRAGQLGEGDAARGHRPLVEEIAYERWHRMLFARFLAENGLLRHPEGATVTLDDCEEIAREQNDGSDRWSVAVDYAVGLLPGIFRPNIPATRVIIAREYRAELEELVVGMPDDVFSSSDGLGWVYQFWQARRKKEINDRVRSTGEKISGADIPPVTQLFTDDYIVRFLLENTLGAWWAGRHPDSPLLAEMPYLRWAEASPTHQPPPHLDSSLRSSSDGEGEQHGYSLSIAADAADGERAVAASAERAPLHQMSPEGRNRDGEGLGWGKKPAAGTFPGWATTTAGLRILDPCCGSGHFLTGAFDLLYRMRMEEDGLSAAEAADAVLRDNLFGLELDRRCTQVAMFNLSMAAWKVGGSPERAEHWPQIAWPGTPIRADASEWEGLTRGRDAWEAEFLRDVYRVFVDAPTLGSLIDLQALIDANPYRMLPRHNRRLQVLLDRILRQVVAEDDRPLFAVNAGEVAHAYDILDQRYDLTVTNVPYLSRGAHDPALRAFADRWHPASKSDLATMMLERCIRFGATGGTVAAVTPQNWLSLGSYKSFRENVLVSTTLNIVAKLGTGAFETISGEVVNVVQVALTQAAPHSEDVFLGLDLSSFKGSKQKDDGLRLENIALLRQSMQLDNPDGRIRVSASDRRVELLSAVVDSFGGITTRDSPRFRRMFWELPNESTDWISQQGPPSDSAYFAGRENLLFWADDGRQLRELAKTGNATIAGETAWNRPGIAVQYTSGLNVTLYNGGPFENVSAILIPKSPDHLLATWSYVRSAEYRAAIRQVDSKLGVTCDTLAKVPFDLDYWQKVAAEKYPNGLPEPHSDDPTQWLFRGQPKGSEQPLHVALARLLGYRWPEQDPSPNPSPSADGEGLQPADGAGEHVAVDEHDAEGGGSTITSGSPSPPQWGGVGEGYDPLDALADPDGIVCLPAVAGEPPAHDRLRALLAAAWSDGWSGDTLDGLLREAGSPGQPVTDLQSWLRDDAFRQHTRLFHNRPFLWHVWDGRKDGFSAFVNYHGLDQPRLDKLTYTYLGDWITRQREEVANNVAGAPARLAAALDLQRRLELIRDGEAPYDVYVRWRGLDQQPVGWRPDLNDGVRLNIRPFVLADVLRVKFNVKWAKDRGANPEGSDVFRWSEAAQRAATPVSRPTEVNGKARLNALHLSLATKRAARGEG